MSAPSGNRRLLFFSPMLAMPSQHGGCVYPHAILSELHCQGFDIDYGWLGAPLTNGRRWMRDPLDAPYVTRGWIRGTRRLGSMLWPATLDGWLGRNEPLPYDPKTSGGDHIATPSERKFATQLIRRLRPHTVLIDSTPMLTLLDDLPAEDRAQLQAAVLTHNLTYRRTELYRAHGQPLDFLPMTRDEETALLNRADVVIAIQEREAEVFRAMLPGKRVITVPMPSVPQPQPIEAETAGRCLFVGGYSGHNIEAVRWLLAEIWPGVRSAVPEAELVIAGTVGRSVKEPPPGVRAIGPVENLKGEYAAASLCLVPLPLGTGLKIKLVEAMSYGRAVVTTPAGAEGFAELEAGDVAVVAEGAKAFTNKVVELLRSAPLRTETARRQLAWIERSLNPKAALSSFTGFL
jgi:glycosyltransferase involved in cell wall biosynthesis